LPLDEFKLQVLQSPVIKVELALEQAVRHTPAPLQHRQSLIDHLFKRHGVFLPSPVVPWQYYVRRSYTLSATPVGLWQA
jgi:hypothetical protein